MESIYDDFIKRACELGAANAKVIDPSTIATGSWVPMKCQFHIEVLKDRSCDHNGYGVVLVE